MTILEYGLKLKKEGRFKEAEEVLSSIQAERTSKGHLWDTRKEEEDAVWVIV